MSFIITSKTRALGMRAPVGQKIVDFNAPSMRGVLARIDFTTGTPVFHGRYAPLHQVGWENPGTGALNKTTPYGITGLLKSGSRVFESTVPVSPITQQSGYMGWRWGLSRTDTSHTLYGPNGTNSLSQIMTIDSRGTEYNTGKPGSRQKFWFNTAGSVTVPSSSYTFAATAMLENQPYHASSWFNGDLAQNSCAGEFDETSAYSGDTLFTESDSLLNSTASGDDTAAYYVDFMDDSPVWTSDELQRNNSFGFDGFWSGYAVYGKRTYFIPAAGGTVYNRTSADTFSTADADTRTATFARDIAEALALVDASSRTATLERSIAEALTLVDASGQTVDSAGAYERDVAEALAFADATTRSVVYERLIAESLTFVDATSSTGGQEIEVATKGGQSMTLRQMRRLEREQLLAMIRQDDDIVVALVSQLLAKGGRLN